MGAFVVIIKCKIIQGFGPALVSAGGEVELISVFVHGALGGLFAQFASGVTFIQTIIRLQFVTLTNGLNLHFHDCHRQHLIQKVDIGPRTSWSFHFHREIEAAKLENHPFSVSRLNKPQRRRNRFTFWFDVRLKSKNEKATYFQFFIFDTATFLCTFIIKSTFYLSYLIMKYLQ